MPYTKPTYDQFIARFPIFGDTDPGVVAALIDEATNTIDTDWVESDYQPAIMYLAAHLIATDNSGEDEEVEVGAEAGAIASESFGPMSISYDNSSSDTSGASSSQYGSTTYGRRFYAILVRNRPAIVVC